MSFLFGGKKKTPEELMREYKRSIDKSVREIERERTKLQTQEKKIITDIKKAAKEGQMGPVKIMAKDLVRTRGQVRYRSDAPSTVHSLPSRETPAVCCARTAETPQLL